MSSHLQQVFVQNHTALAQASPEQATVKFEATSRGLDGLHRRVQIRDFSV